MTMGSSQLTILLPVRNEALNLKIMLKLLKAVLDIPHEVLVIYDDEKDVAPIIVSEINRQYPNVQAVFNQQGRGVANAIRCGVAAATSERILIFAADEVGPILAIEDMIELMDGGVEFVSCTRYAYGGRRLGGSPLGHLLSFLANKFLRLFSSVALTDSTTGIKMFRKSDFSRLTHDSFSAGWAVAFEMAVNAQILDLKLGEVPIISIDRLYGGKSTFQVIPWIKGYLNYFWLAMTKLPVTAKKPEVALKIPLNINGAELETE